MKPEGQESRNPEDSAPSVNETPEAMPVPPTGNMVEPRRSYKGWIIGCLGALLLGISICWFYSQRHVLSESEAHTEMVFKFKPYEEIQIIYEDSNTLGVKIPITDEAKEQVIEALKNRLKDYGVKHSVMGNGEDLISVKLPSLTPGELKGIRGLLTNHGKLDFRLSHPDSAALIRDNEQFVPGAERMRYEQKGKSGERIVYEHFISKKVVLSGKHIISASPRRNDLTGEPEIHFTLDPIGSNIFAKITERHRVGNGDERLLAIVVGGNLISAPSINGRFHSRGQITGDFTIEEATALANALENQLENQVLLNQVVLIEEKDLK